MTKRKIALSGSCGQTDFPAVWRFNMPEPIQSEIVARRVSHEIVADAANPAIEWQAARPIRFSADWQGNNPDPALETEVRVLWSRATLYLRFVCHHRELFVFQDSDPNGRRGRPPLRVLQRIRNCAEWNVDRFSHLSFGAR